jgi:1-acyl-sn-glycerol-3-phosphate acyltransferase
VDSYFKIIIILAYTIILSIIGGAALLTRNGEEKYHALAVHWARVILKISGVRATIKGKEKLEQSKSYIYVANHASMFDVWILFVLLPGQIRFVFKKELTRIPIFGWVLRHSGHVVLDRSSRNYLRSLEEARVLIERGRSVVIFPEGTRTADGKLQPFKRGSFALALRALATIIPITINGSFKIFRKGSMRIHPGDVEVVVGDPIEVASKDSERMAELELMKRTRSVIESSYKNQ